MSEPERLLYVYGIVPPGLDVSRAPSGLGGAPPRAVPAGAFAALVSHVPASEFSPTEIERRSGEMDWISPRAVEHDRVLTWAQDHGGIIPMPMFSMWESESALRQSLADREAELAGTFARVSDSDEYGLRIHRRDREMLAVAHELDESIAALRREADAAGPGQRYLLEAKIAQQSKQAVRVASQRLAKETWDALRPLAREAVTRPLTPSSAAPADATLVLNAAFLVERGGLEAFRAELTRRMKESEPRGLSFDFTGPWPPYNFVS